jgi:hypothetical protein
MESPQAAEKDSNMNLAIAKDEEPKVDVKAATAVNVDADVEFVRSPVLYSKRSIFFMTLFSGLAIGSDAYNSASMGQLLLLFGLLYPDTLSVATQAQLTNAFIIGLVSVARALGGTSRNVTNLNRRFWGCYRSASSVIVSVGSQVQF